MNPLFLKGSSHMHDVSPRKPSIYFSALPLTKDLRRGVSAPVCVRKSAGSNLAEPLLIFWALAKSRLQSVLLSIRNLIWESGFCFPVHRLPQRQRRSWKNMSEYAPHMQYSDSVQPFLPWRSILSLSINARVTDGLIYGNRWSTVSSLHAENSYIGVRSATIKTCQGAVLRIRSLRSRWTELRCEENVLVSLYILITEPGPNALLKYWIRIKIYGFIPGYDF